MVMEHNSAAQAAAAANDPRPGTGLKKYFGAGEVSQLLRFGAAEVFADAGNDEGGNESGGAITIDIDAIMAQAKAQEKAEREAAEARRAAAKARF